MTDAPRTQTQTPPKEKPLPLDQPIVAPPPPELPLEPAPSNLPVKDESIAPGRWMSIFHGWGSQARHGSAPRRDDSPAVPAGPEKLAKVVAQHEAKCEASLRASERATASMLRRLGCRAGGLTCRVIAP